jgi:uncharacterized membrane protein
MNQILRFLQIFGLGTWIGGIIFLSFIEAPGVFSILSNREQAGSIVGYSLTRLHYIGMIAAVIYLVAGLALAKSARWLMAPAAILVILMLALARFRVWRPPAHGRAAPANDVHRSHAARKPRADQFRSLPPRIRAARSHHTPTRHRRYIPNLPKVTPAASAPIRRVYGFPICVYLCSSVFICGSKGFPQLAPEPRVPQSQHY